MDYLKKSFIFGVAVFMALALGAPAMGSQLEAASQPKYSDKDVALSVRVSPGWGYRGGYYGGYRGYYPRYRYYSPGYRYYSPGYRYYNNPYRYNWRYGW